MAQQSGNPTDTNPLTGEVKFPDPAKMSRAMADIARRSQALVSQFLQRTATEPPGSGDPLNIGNAFFEMTSKMMADPAKLMQAQMSLWNDYLTLWQRTTQKLMGEEAEPVVVPTKDDKRFKDAAWDENALFDFI